MKKLLLLLSLALLGVVPAAFADWVPAAGPYGGYVNCFLDDGAMLYAGTDSGYVFASTDTGRNWSVPGTGPGAPMSVYGLIKVNTLLGDGNLLIATNDGLFTSLDSAKTWARAGNSDSGRYTSVFQYGRRLLAGAWDQPRVSTDEGLTWTVTGNGISAYYPVLAWYALDNRLFVGTDDGAFVSLDSGASFTRSDSGAPPNSPIRAFQFFKDKFYMGTTDGVYVSSDSGANWTPACPAVLSYTPIQTLAASDTILYAGSNNAFYLSNDPLLNWSASGAGLPAGGVSAIRVNNDTLLAGLDGGGVYRSTDGSASWSASNSGMNNVHFSFLREIGGRIYAGCWNGFSVSSDTGKSWTGLNNGLPGTLPVASFSTFGSIFFLGVSSWGAYMSPDSGQTWYDASSGLWPNGAFSFAALGDKLFAGVWNDGVYMTGDTGRSWTHVSTSFPAYTSVSAMIAIDSLLLAGTFGKGIYASLDTGKTWSLLTIGPPSGIYQFFMAGSDLLAATSGEGVYRSPDSGITWQNMSTGLPEFGSVTSLTSDSNGNLFAGMAWDGFYYSKNNGTTWHPALQGLNTMTIPGVLAVGGTVFAGTDGNGLFQRSIDEILALPIVDVLASGAKPSARLALLPNQPNPFNPVTTLRFTLPREGFVTLSVYTLAGQKVAVPVSQRLCAGLHAREFNASRLSSGVYLCRLQFGHTVLSQKIVFVK